MDYLAIQQDTALWLLRKDGILEELANVIASQGLRNLRKGDFLAGPIRISADRDVVMLVNADFAAGTGDEPLGFIRIAPRLGIASNADAATMALTRAVFVICQRLQNRTFWADSRYRKIDDSRYTISIGGLESPLSLAWAEKTLQAGATITRVVFVIGPYHDENNLAEAAESYSFQISALMNSVRTIMSGNSTRGILSDKSFTSLREAIDPSELRQDAGPFDASGGRLTLTVQARRADVTPQDIYRTLMWSYDQWCNPALSTLSKEQRSILEQNAPLTQPLRIVGPGGAGKTLLMQLMAIKCLREKPGAKVLYLTHNEAMEESVRARFARLLNGAPKHAAQDLFAPISQLHVTTLARYSMELTGLRRWQVISLNPERAKDDAFNLVKEALSKALASKSHVVEKSENLRVLTADETAFRYFAEYVRAEISMVIKGRGMILDRGAYTDAQDALGHLHAVLSPEERDVIYDAYINYRDSLREYEVLDSDDVALSVLGRLMTPQWEYERRQLGFDYVFVDEAQLFNDNERQIFALLTTSQSPHTLVAIALDEAQRLYSMTASGFGRLGIEDLQRRTLHVMHRLSESIAKLAFYVISQGSAPFGNEFPELKFRATDAKERMHSAPSLHVERLEKFAERIYEIVRVGAREGLMQFAVVVHSETAMAPIREGLPKLVHSDFEFRMLRQRGETISGNYPTVILAPPELIGGQEFDCVISCGLEEGVIPPQSIGGALAARLEQQAYREIYLTFTRARHRLHIMNMEGSALTPVLSRARHLGLLKDAG
ncbi:MAG: UvrD-helicase domain-containing protein [Candidatus Eremiobacteraeota bacterium]|nr:UvrD-helicase domain-containing protein [Candidatus Eremiobacteraeota bacterium]